MILHAFVRENHVALKGSGKGKLNNLVFAKDVFRFKVALMEMVILNG